MLCEPEILKIGQNQHHSFTVDDKGSSILRLIVTNEVHVIVTEIEVWSQKPIMLKRIVELDKSITKGARGDLDTVNLVNIPEEGLELFGK